MLRSSHPLFAPASEFPTGSGQTPAQVAASLPRDFSANSHTISAETMIETGETAHDGLVLQQPAPLQGQQPAPQLGQQPQPQPQMFQPPELQPLPAPLQPVQQPGPVQKTEVPDADPVASMSATMRQAFPNETPGQIAQRVATALAPPAQQKQEEVVDPDVLRAEQVETQISTLREQARTEGTSDLDAEIHELEREQIRLDARLEARQEFAEREEITAFAAQSTQWDSLAGQTFPDADRTGSPLKAAVDAKIAEIIQKDPAYFTRATDAGYQLVACEAAKLGISPQRQQQGSPPSPGAPGTIPVLPAMPGSLMGSHRPAQTVQLTPGQAFAQNLQAAEQGGLAGELALAQRLVQSGFMSQGVQFVS